MLKNTNYVSNYINCIKPNNNIVSKPKENIILSLSKSFPRVDNNIPFNGFEVNTNVKEDAPLYFTKCMHSIICFT